MKTSASIIFSLFFVFFSFSVTFSATSLAYAPYTEEELNQFRQTLPIGQLLAEPRQKGKEDIKGSCKESHWIIPVEDPFEHSTWIIEAELFFPIQTEISSVPLMLMMPPINGIMYMDHKMAKHFCEQGIAAFSFDPVRSQDRVSKRISLESYEKTLIRMLTAAHWAFETASGMPGIDSSRVGVMGMSLGGIFASLYAAYDQRVQTLIYVASAGYLPGVLANTKQNKLAKLRKIQMKKNSWKNVEFYEEALVKLIRHDPYLWSNGLKGKKIMAILSDIDKLVPTQYQVSFAELIRPQVVQTVRLSHTKILLKAPNMFSDEFAKFIKFAN